MENFTVVQSSLWTLLKKFCQALFTNCYILCYINLHREQSEQSSMYTIQLDNGLTNTYAVETKPYYAEFPAPYQQRRYLIQGAIAAFFVTSLVIVSTVIR